MTYHAKSFTDFLLESKSQNASVHILDDNYDFRKNMLEALCESGVFNELEAFLVKDSLSENYYNDIFEPHLYEGSIMDKWREKWQKAKETVKKAGEDALTKAQEMVLKIGQSVGSVLKMIMKAIKDFFASIWPTISSAAESAVKSIKGEIITAAGLKRDPKKEEQKAKEIANATAIGKFAVTYCVEGFSQKIVQTGQEVVKTDENYAFSGFVNRIYERFYSESLVLLIKNKGLTRNEILKETDLHNDEKTPIPYLGTILKKLYQYPPFSLISGIKEKAGQLAANGLEYVSSLLTSLAKAPGPFKFPWAGAELAKLALSKFLPDLDKPQTMIASYAKSAINKIILTTCPIIGIVLKILEYGAKILSWIKTAVTQIRAALKNLGAAAPETFKTAANAIDDFMDLVSGNKKKEEDKKDGEDKKEGNNT